MASGERPGQPVHTLAPYFGFATNLLCDTGVGAISLFLTHPSIQEISTDVHSGPTRG